MLITIFHRYHHFCCLILVVFFPTVGVEVSQGVGGIREVLPEDEASVIQRAPSAAASATDERV